MEAELRVRAVDSKYNLRGMTIWLRVMGGIFWVLGAVGFLVGLVTVAGLLVRFGGSIDLSGNVGMAWTAGAYSLTSGAMLLIGSVICFAFAEMLRILVDIEANTRAHGQREAGPGSAVAE
jgi:hypothetical protein